jgi:hypothetical protein
MDAFQDIKRRFSNQRQWRDFAAALQCSVNYPAIMGTVRSGSQWFSGGLARASGLTPTVIDADPADCRTAI